MNAISYLSNLNNDEALVEQAVVSERRKEEEAAQEWFLLKPVYLLWFIITSPLILIEYGLKSRKRVEEKRVARKGETGNQSTHSDKKQVDDDEFGGEEIYLQRDVIKGSLFKASSTSSSLSSRGRGNVFGTKKMGRFLFPKKLVPQSILYAERRKKLVVDLDETLIHSAARSTSHSNSSQGHMVEVKFGSSSISTLYYVHKRPHCDAFLSQVSKWYDLVIFTASMKEYADPVIDWLEGCFPGRFERRLYRHNCVLRDGVGYIKDLSVVAKALEEVVLIDNSPTSYAMNEDNAIQVEGWISDPSDSDLLNLLPLLEALRYSTDVRSILALKNGERAFVPQATN
ncbi:related to Nuclear envelope morphology protein 1 [Zygosaccharomyces bailii]|uniref:ZYBA0S05-05842g1_1 n=1 Tax=Zygosaccharomyces bailii (strain CLIB 213 / ATCC 58445 / CBS 680 / BCRC 21525 / NBRC 1098 / NCYC 1416 / NRRL Y-2227) TaxID=1333698 RepID=A0A8J2T9M8_ZYGB2|nr:ZYBA0S05-05842g1_1 [Zygosaccharomyces bailii CLIB 213]CDH17723.1 related to Nuclear envelope morphology protein 1 [Zygosaccharomyces bailii ISA1307]SJM84419.1 related to Nuclear envelope morphology protein 1 [Zygosaccharomyces bailii]